MALSKLAAAARCPPRPVTAPATTRVGVVVQAKGSQKNQGLYFEYQSVDPKAQEEVVQEKEKVQEEFAWVRRARDTTKRHPGLEEKEEPQGKGKKQHGRYNDYKDVKLNAPPTRRPNPAGQAAAAAPKAAPPAAQAAAAPATANPHPQPNAAPTGPAIAASTSATPAPASVPTSASAPAAASVSNSPIDAQSLVRGASSKPAAPALAPVPDMGDEDAPAAAGNMSTRKRQLLARMKAVPPPTPMLSPSSAPTPSSSPAATPETPTSSTHSTPSNTPHSSLPLSAASAAAAGAAAAAAAAAAASKPQAEVVSVPPLQGLPELPALGTGGEGLSGEEQEAEELLRALLSPELEGVRGDAEDVAAAEVSAEREFDAWVQQLRGAQDADSAAGEQSSGDGQKEMGADELQALLGEVGGAGRDVASVLASARDELTEFRSLLQALDAGAGTGGAPEDGEVELSEAQLLASLQKSDPALHALLTSAVALEDDAEVDELGAALDSFERMGLGGDDTGSAASALASASGAAGSSGPAAPAHSSSGPRAAGATAGATAATASATAGATAEEEEGEEELMSDDELARLAAADPDLAALLQGDDARLESAIKGLTGEEDDEDEDDGEMGEDEGVEFSDLFDAIEEDPDISEEDRARARFELQSMFNAAAREAAGPEAVHGSTRGSRKGTDGGQPVNHEVLAATTTGSRKGGAGEEAAGEVPLLPKPKPTPRKAA